ncbi:hypothetical protein [Lelliottia aquatilis]|uniref:hypothetical protein n=1 Tax=Lelliottia aquatilis TaxID=2080838 RepID=UPI0013FDB84B|nr:hypothetical protein [Lelliottia aquatilis]
MDQPVGFVDKILFMHPVFIYTDFVRSELRGPQAVNRRNEVLAETGGAVSALTPK